MGEKQFVSFGEIMLRLSPPGHQRFLQASSFDAVFGGGEANVAVSLAQLGVPSLLVSAVPNNEIGQAAVNSLRGWGVDTSRIVRSGDRLGIYFLEHGSSQRGSNVLYDRKGSSIGDIDPDRLDWDAIFAGASWFHFTGITPALSTSAANATAQAAEAAKRLGLTVSCDLNYRKKLWTREQAQQAMSELMKHVDVLVANEEDCESVFGISGEGTDVESGKIDHAKYSGVASQIVSQFGIRTVAITLRESHSASRNGWSAMLYADGKPHFSRPLEIDIIDRVGSGDAFAAGLIYSLMNDMAAQHAIEFASAAGCLKHSVIGDFNICSVAEIEALAKGGGSGRVQR